MPCPSHIKIEVDSIDFKILQWISNSLKTTMSIMIGTDLSKIDAIESHLKTHEFVLYKHFSPNDPNQGNANSLFTRQQP